MPMSKTPQPGWADSKLVTACLDGDEQAWSALVDKYKRLVFSIVVKYGANPEEAADLFQSIWLDAYNDLHKLRNHDAVKSWLISLTNHKCFHWKRKLRRQQRLEIETEDPELEVLSGFDPAFAEDLERQQLVRQALGEISERCQKMIHMLFFTFPPKPYQEVAELLGLATGSIGFIRGRCLKQLERALKAMGI